MQIRRPVPSWSPRWGIDRSDRRRKSSSFRTAKPRRIRVLGVTSTARDAKNDGIKIASLRDVARTAGVSVSTASRVLSGSSHPVSEPTRRRVLEAAERLGFEPNRLARALATARSRTIGVVVHDVSDPYYAEIVRGLEDAAGSRERSRPPRATAASPLRRMPLGRTPSRREGAIPRPLPPDHCTEGWKSSNSTDSAAIPSVTSRR